MASSLNPFLWSPTPASNDVADPAINWAEGQTPGSVNGSARAMMAALARLIADLNGTRSTGGTGNAYTLAAANLDHATLGNGLLVSVRASFTNTGAATFNLNSLGAKKIRSVTTAGEGDLAAGQMQGGGTYLLRYDTAADGGNGAWILLNPPADSGIPTGVVKPYVGATAPPGYVRANGRTIGSTASAATERNNDDTFALFKLLWDSWSNTEAPVSGGRGASAAADFAASKTIQLPDLRGRAPFGKGDMGNADAARITAGGSGIAGATLGASGGAETVALTTAQIPAHSHTFAATTAAASIDHTHNFSGTTAGESGHSHSGTTDNQSNDHTHSDGVAAAGFNSAQSPAGAGFNTLGAFSAGSTGGVSAGHTHTFTSGAANQDHVHAYSGTTGANNTSTSHAHAVSGTTGAAGTGGAHTNMPGAIIMLYIIKL